MRVVKKKKKEEFQRKFYPPPRHLEKIKKKKWVVAAPDGIPDTVADLLNNIFYYECRKYTGVVQ